jgi:hypothetical protein
MERSDHGLFVVLPQHLPGWTEENQERLRIVSTRRDSKRPPLEYISELLPVEPSNSVIPDFKLLISLWH